MSAKKTNEVRAALKQAGLTHQAAAAAAGCSVATITRAAKRGVWPPTKAITAALKSAIVTALRVNK